MCDYSLHGIPNRLAVEGEELVFHRFDTGTIGLTASGAPGACNDRRHGSGWRGWLRRFFEAPRDPAVAVCIPPGAELRLKGVPRDLQRQWRIGEEETVRFTQLSAAPYMHRDALRLPHGEEVLLQRIREAIRAQVISLGGDPEPVERTPEVIESPVTPGSRRIR